MSSQWVEVDYDKSTTVNQKALYKVFTFQDFRSAMLFANKVGDIADSLGHHPDITISWGKVCIWTTTHDKHKITEKDHRLAKEIDTIQAS